MKWKDKLLCHHYYFTKLSSHNLYFAPLKFFLSHSFFDFRSKTYFVTLLLELFSQTCFVVYFREQFRTDGSSVNQSVAKAISNANLPNGQRLDDEHIWRGPVIVLKAKYGGALPSDNVKYQVGQQNIDQSTWVQFYKCQTLAF